MTDVTLYDERAVTHYVGDDCVPPHPPMDDDAATLARVVDDLQDTITNLGRTAHLLEQTASYLGQSAQLLAETLRLAHDEEGP